MDRAPLTGASSFVQRQLKAELTQLNHPSHVPVHPARMEMPLGACARA